jgi:hypothetical protein
MLTDTTDSYDLLWRAIAGVARDDGVFAWRMQELDRLGVEGPEAVALAVRPQIDLHTASDMISAGCPAGTALRILG